jgi:hypothetical protein
MNHATRSRLPLHYLFLLPESATSSEQDAVTKAARELTTVGYVYVESASEKTLDVRDDIRFMPLKVDSLPHFDALAGVMVVRDHQLAHVAQEAYPGAKVTVIDPVPAASKQRHEWRLVPWRPVHPVRIRPFTRVSPVPDAAA